MTISPIACLLARMAVTMPPIGKGVTKDDLPTNTN